MSDQSLQQLQRVPTEERQIEYTPFGAEQKLKLSIKMVQQFIAQPTKSKLTCSDRDAMRFLMLCQARGLNPWEGDCFMIGYDTEDGPVFSLITAHQAFLKRAELNPDFDGMESGVVVRTEAGNLEDHSGDFVDDTEKLLGGWAKVHFKNRQFPIYRKLHIGCFMPERPSPLWKKNAAGMICKTAEADALRSAFPTKCGGMYLQQEIETTAGLGTPQLPKPAEAFAITNGNGAHSTPDGATATQTTENHAETPPARQTTPEASPQEKLRVFVEQEGFDFATLTTYCEGVEFKPKGSTWNGFEDVPEALAKRLMRATDGLKRNLANVKGVAQ